MNAGVWVRVGVCAAMGAVVVGAALLGGCDGDCQVRLSGGGIVGCDEVPPGPDDPAFGSETQALVEDATSTDRLWIGFSSGEEVDLLRGLECSSEPYWVGGTVVIATNRDLGFFFDPSTTIARMEEDLGDIGRTTIAAIADDPEPFTPQGEGGRVLWVVPGDVVATEPPVECTTQAFEADRHGRLKS